MTQSIHTFEGSISLDRPFLSWKLVTVPAACLISFSSLLLGVWILKARPIAAPELAEAPAAATSAPADLSNPYGALIVDLRSHSRSKEAFLSQGPINEAILRSIPEQPAQAAETLRPSLAPPSVEPQLVEAPLPPRRPDDLKAIASAPPQQAPLHRLARTDARTVVPAAPADDRSFLEKFFSFGQPVTSTPQASAQQQPPRTAVAYAATPDAGGGLFSALHGGGAAAPAPRAGNQTAVYDISAHTVYLPNGTRLEAHSGLGARLDDPRFVHERMRGATPPAVYELSPREQLFHGVQALRLTPVSGSVYGRAGLLAHTYMLGPNGDSNGCVSFRDYHAFLRAYQNGEIKRLAVVTRAN
jgi:hypothetical protein